MTGGLVAGVDEVGRGPLAGPVVTAAVILDPARIPAGLADSKTLSRARREALYPVILAQARAVAFASASAATIDGSDIRAATLAAMGRAVAALAVAPGLVLVDGRDACAAPCAVRAVIGGDALEPCIAAASIVAKVLRDRMMARLDAAIPPMASRSTRATARPPTARRSSRTAPARSTASRSRPSRDAGAAEAARRPAKIAAPKRDAIFCCR